jgi:uncharacterized protein (DUF1499 family)
MRTFLYHFTLCWIGVSLTSCVSGSSAALGVKEGHLAKCPATPNCVSSDDDDAHFLEPLAFDSSPEAAWQALLDVVETLPRVCIVTAGQDYLHAEVRSRIFRFIDDVEFHLRPTARIIAVRSASRVGYSDLGANRKRVEHIRRSLQKHGVLSRR